MTSLELAKRNFRACAAALDKAYESYTIDELANGYCDATDAGDEDGRDAYYSALMLRFWSKISKCYQKCRSLELTYEDCYSLVNGAITLACAPENRAWRKSSKVKAEQVINQTLATRFIAAEYYRSNLKKNNGKHRSISLETPVSDDGSRVVTIGDLIPDESYTYDSVRNDNHFVIQDYINQGKLVEAIILENISTKDVFKHSKRVSVTKDESGNEMTFKQKTSEFWSAKLVRELNSLDNSYVEYFGRNYKVKPAALTAAFVAVKSAANTKKYKMIDATLDDFRKNVKNYYDLPNL